jgi:mono/diheme cytochrome c family protein
VVKNLRPLIALLAIGLIIPAPAQTQESRGGQSTSAGAAPAADARVPYSMGMGEIMTVGVQPRHIRLAAAVRAGDWAYAAYALKELGETWNRISRAIPKYQGQTTADLVGGFTKEPMNALDEAIKAADAKRFKTAYAQLTQNCNACHQATGRAAVVIKVPTTSDASADQDLKASKP